MTDLAGSGAWPLLVSGTVDLAEGRIFSPDDGRPARSLRKGNEKDQTKDLAGAPAAIPPGWQGLDGNAGGVVRESCFK